MNVTGFFGLYRIKELDFTADYANVDCPTGSSHGDWWLCPCADLAVLETKIVNVEEDSYLPGLVSDSTAQSFDTELTYKVPSTAPGGCANVDFAEAVPDLDAPDWSFKTRAGTSVQAFDETVDVTLSSAFSAGERYVITHTAYDAFGNSHQTTHEFLADHCPGESTPLCPGTNWCVSNPKHCPCASEATFTSPTVLTSPQHKLIFDRSLTMTVTGAATFKTNSTTTAVDLGVTCADRDFSYALESDWSITPDIEADLSEVSSSTIDFAAFDFEIETNYTLTMTSTFSDTSIESVGARGCSSGTRSGSGS